MMDNGITRGHGPNLDLTCAVDPAASDEFDARWFAGGMIRSDTSGTFTIFVSTNAGEAEIAEADKDPYEQFYDYKHEVVTMTLTANTKQELPPSWFSLRFVKLGGVAAAVTISQKA
jgi:hypothetical protein